MLTSTIQDVMTKLKTFEHKKNTIFMYDVFIFKN